MPITISQLYIYPIKSCAGIPVENILLDALGAIHDRRYMLVDASGGFITQRQYARLVHVQLHDHAAGWLVSLPGGACRVLPFCGTMDTSAQVTVWRDTFPAYDQGDEWAGFFSAFLGQPVRLVYTGQDTRRRIDPFYCPESKPVSFADGFPLLVANESSLQVLNGTMEKPVEMLRFRPNVVVKGAQPFAEHKWSRLRSPGASLAIVKPCSRCVIPTINRQTAVRESSVWEALRRHCAGEDGQVYFGQNAIHEGEGVLRTGDSLEVT